MPIRLQRVLPGDLIRSQLLTELDAVLSTLAVRIAALENTGVGEPVVITRVEPDRVVTPGERIRVIGSGFSVPGVLNEVRFDDTLATALTSMSSATELVVDIPTLPGLGADRTEVVLSVRNHLERTATHVLQMSGRVDKPVGTATVAYAEAPLGSVLKAGERYLLGFELVSTTDQTATYNVDARVNAAGWSARVVPRPDGSSRISLPENPAGSRATIQVELTAGASGDVELVVVAAEETNPDQLFGRQTVPLGVGKPIPAPATDVRMAFVPVDGGSVSAQAGVVLFTPKSSNQRARFDVTFQKAGVYTVQAVMRSAVGATWTINSATPPDFTVSQTLPFTSTWNVFISNTGTSTAELVVTVRRAAELEVSFIQPVATKKEP